MSKLDKLTHLRDLFLKAEEIASSSRYEAMEFLAKEMQNQVVIEIHNAEVAEKIRAEIVKHRWEAWERRNKLYEEQWRREKIMWDAVTAGAPIEHSPWYKRLW